MTRHEALADLARKNLTMSLGLFTRGALPVRELLDAQAEVREYEMRAIVFN